jgi:hypothetical protein
VNVVDLLVCDPAIVLQDVEVLRSNGGSDLLCNRKELCKVVVGDVCELLAVELGDDKLTEQPGQYESCPTGVGPVLTAWPLLKGLMSRKANVFSLSKSFMEGISPVVWSESRLHQRLAPSTHP